MQIQGTLPDTWGEEYKADLNSVTIPKFTVNIDGIQQPEGYISNESMNKVVKAITWVEKEFQMMHRGDPVGYREKKDRLIDTMHRINKKHGVERLREATTRLARPIFEEYMQLFRRLGYKGDTDYAG